MSVKVSRLDLALRGDSLPADPAMNHAADVLFTLSGYGALDDSTYSSYRHNPSILIHERAVDSVWHDLRDLEAGIGRMKFNFTKLFPDDSFPAVYSIVSPFNQSVFTADSLLFLGLNHYLGETYEPYAYFPDYMRRRKTPSRVLPDMAEAIVCGNYVYVTDGEYPTVLSRLLYEGAVTEAVMQLTGLDEQQVLGYDDAEMAWAAENERQIWRTMAERRMLFSTDRQIAMQLVNPAPFTSAVNPSAPGQIGRFIGHRIVAAYLDRHAITLPQLLDHSFYESPTALRDSGYN